MTMALVLPINVNVDVYRGFSAASPYPVAAVTKLSAPQVPGNLQHNVRLGRLGRGQYLHWTHVLYLPPGTDVRGAYNSQLNSSPSAQADTIEIADYPIPGWCTAFAVVLVQRVGRGTPGDCLRVYLDRVQPRLGPCQTGESLPCCPNPLPDRVYATIANVAGCACIDGFVLPLDFDNGLNRWGGVQTVCGGVSSLTLFWFCGDDDCTTARVVGSYDGFNAIAATVDPGCSCSPLNMVFSNVALGTPQSTCANATLKITITA